MHGPAAREFERGEWNAWYQAREKFASAEGGMIREAAFRQMLRLVTADNPPPAPVQRRKRAVPVRAVIPALAVVVALVIAVCVLTVSII